MTPPISCRQVRGGQVDGDALGRDDVAAVLDRGDHALAPFLDGALRKADGVEGGEAARHVRFHGDEVGVDAEDGAGEGTSEQGGPGRRTRDASDQGCLRRGCPSSRCPRLVCALTRCACLARWSGQRAVRRGRRSYPPERSARATACAPDGAAGRRGIREKRRGRCGGVRGTTLLNAAWERGTPAPMGRGARVRRDLQSAANHGF